MYPGKQLLLFLLHEESPKSYVYWTEEGSNSAFIYMIRQKNVRLFDNNFALSCEHTHLPGKAVLIFFFNIKLHAVVP